jgi:hypothetical protein
MEQNACATVVNGEASYRAAPLKISRRTRTCTGLEGPNEGQRQSARQRQFDVARTRRSEQLLRGIDVTLVSQWPTSACQHECNVSCIRLRSKQGHYCPKYVLGRCLGCIHRSSVSFSLSMRFWSVPRKVLWSSFHEMTSSAVDRVQIRVLR